MKRSISIFLSILMIAAACLSLFSCSGKDDKDGSVAYVLAEKGNEYSLGLGENFKVAFEKSGGNVTMETFPAGSQSFSEYFSKAVDIGAEVIFLPNSLATAPDLLKNAKDLGIDVPILAGDTWESSVILEAVKDTGLEVYCTTFFDEAESAGNENAEEFVSGFKKFLTENSEYFEMNGSNDMVAAVSALGFDAYNVAMKAIRSAASAKGADLTSIDVAKALWETDHAGVCGDIVFDDNGDAIKDQAYIKKAAADGSAFEFVKVQTVDNNAEIGKAPAYEGEGISIDKDNKRITVGVFQPTTGNDASGGKQELLGIIYANSLDNIVEIGGVEYEIVLNISDNGSLQEYALATATTLCDEGSVVVIGSYGSGVSMAAAEVFEGACVPAIGASCTNAKVTAGNRYYFRTTIIDSFQGSVMADFANSLIEKAEK